MTRVQDYIDRSQQRHRDDWQAAGPESLGTARAGTIDGWRHARMYDITAVLAEPGQQWLTVGDGHYGQDAQHLATLGVEVLATDLDDRLLGQAAAAGALGAYRAENAESLSCADETYDYVLCKEAFHHFPRPWSAFHEMLRVSRRGLVLIEPQDGYLHRSLAEAAAGGLKSLIGKLLGLRQPEHRFEPSGNYVYALSRRELEKAALAVGRGFLAMRSLNVPYLPSLARRPTGPWQMSYQLLRLTVAVMDLLSAVGLWKANLLVAVVLHESPSSTLRQRLRAAGYGCIDLPRNPYLGGLDGAQSPTGGGS